ncbi:serine protease family s10 serine carboxypeptidase [Holotrichia oblita]|uniref:Serine protease family s10 serine carboxypeptidase n=1 Tax=Holotrichia oblita TaxID=644536 RepID=A0ACB9T2X4_HOLOL|nr:serine protease family s10 serine carboxypeptidase [Holotrichia oblita]
MPKTRSVEGDSGDNIQGMLTTILNRLDGMISSQNDFENRLNTLEEKVNETVSVSNPNVSNSIPPANVNSNLRQNSNLNESNFSNFINNVKLKDLVPKYDGKRGSPVIFLTSIRRVITPDTSSIQLYNIIRSALIDNAFIWFSIIESSFSTFEEFEDLFLSKYWSETEQHKIRRNLFTGKFDLQKGNSREHYFINKYAVAQHLTPKLSENELIKHFARHFDFDINKTVIIQNITYYKDFCEVLRQYDNLYQFRKSVTSNS